MTALADDLVTKILSLNTALSAAGLPFAFGGAIALGYATSEPRMTRDIGLNVFVDHHDAQTVLDALPACLDIEPGFVDVLIRDGQGRIADGLLPIDLFLTNMEFHVEARERVRVVSFAGTSIPVLAALDILVFKAMFDRPKDWVDIGEIFAAESVSLADATGAVTQLVGPDDHRLVRLSEVANDARRA